MAQPPPFEIPQQLRDLTEKNLEHARTAYGQFMDAMTQAMGMWTNASPAGAMTGGFKVVQDRAVKFAKQNADACFNLASELANAKDLTDVLSIQSRHAQTQLQSYALQAQELSRLDGGSRTDHAAEVGLAIRAQSTAHNSRAAPYLSGRSRRRIGGRIPTRT